MVSHSLLFYSLYPHFSRHSCLVNDTMCVLALSGIALMILTNEIYFTTLPHQQTSITWFIKLIITLSTIALICLIVYYHYLDMLLFSVNKSLQYWYIALTRPRVTQIIVEIIICAIHPFPHPFPHYNYLPSQLPHDKSTDSVPATIPLSFIPIDVALGLPSKHRLTLLLLVHRYSCSVCSVVLVVSYSDISFTLSSRFVVAIDRLSQ